MARNAIITVREIDDLKDKGLTQSEIARMHGVTRAYISWIKHTYGGKLSPREEALQSWPWEVREPHTKCSPYQRLRDHAEYMVTDGKGMNEGKLSRLRAWYSTVNSVVVEYGLDIPPTPGIKSGGFRYVAREPSDGNLLIRVAGEDILTPEGKELFTRPTVLP